MVSKKGQMKMSFGMIFSIILIIIFVAFAFYAIKLFLNMQNSIQVGKFVDDLQVDIDKIWKSHQASQEVEYSLPKKVQKVCFVDYNSPASGANRDLYDKLKQVYYEFENIIFYPIGSAEGLDALEVLHIDLVQTTSSSNPLCFENTKGKVEMKLKMSSGESLVTIVK